MMAIDNEHKIKLLCDKYIKYLFIACAFFMTVIIFSIILFIGNQGLMTFKDVGVIEFFFSSKWDPWAGEYGAASFIVGSITVTLLAIIIGGPLGLAGAIFMAKIAPKWVRELMRPATDLYVAIPSVVYGYIGLTLFIPFFRDVFGVTTGFGVFVAGVILAIMILPIIDTLNVIIIRLAEKRSPFDADKNHIHHKLLKLGITHKRATLYIISYYLFIVIISYFLRHIEVNLLLILILILGFLGAYLPDFFYKRKINN